MKAALRLHFWGVRGISSEIPCPCIHGRDISELIGGGRAGLLNIVKRPALPTPVNTA